MSKFERVKQWAAFSRNWHIYDAKWQNPFTSAKAITKVRKYVQNYLNYLKLMMTCNVLCCVGVGR